MVITHSILFLGCQVVCLSCQHVNFKQLSGVVQLCNGFIQLEQNFENYFGNPTVVHKPKSKSTDLFLRGMSYILTCTTLSAQVVNHVDILRDPCFPVYVGYWLNPQCGNDTPGHDSNFTWSFVEVLTKVAMLVVVCFCWSPLYSGGDFQMSLEYIMEGHCFQVGLKEFGR